MFTLLEMCSQGKSCWKLTQYWGNTVLNIFKQSKKSKLMKCFTACSFKIIPEVLRWYFIERCNVNGLEPSKSCIPPSSPKESSYPCVLPHLSHFIFSQMGEANTTLSFLFSLLIFFFSLVILQRHLVSYNLLCGFGF